MRLYDRRDLKEVAQHLKEDVEAICHRDVAALQVKFCETDHWLTGQHSLFVGMEFERGQSLDDAKASATESIQSCKRQLAEILRSEINNHYRERDRQLQAVEDWVKAQAVRVICNEQARECM